MIRQVSYSDFIGSSGLKDWLETHIGRILRSDIWWFDTDEPIIGDGWRVVKLYQKDVNSSVSYEFYLEFDDPLDYIYFLLLWN